MNDHTQVERRFISVRNLAREFSISPATIYRLLKAGKIKAVKIGAATRVEMKSVETYFASLPSPKPNTP